MKYVLGIGTNIGNRKENIEKALEAVSLLPKTEIFKKSAVYETSPVGYADQQNFYNICLLCESELDPHEMLGACLGIEAGFGRVRTIKNGPRIIDIDMIFAQNLSLNEKNLIVPHPRYSERLFVLKPLEDIFEDKTAFGIDFSSYAKKISGQEIKRI